MFVINGTRQPGCSYKLPDTCFVYVAEGAKKTETYLFCMSVGVCLGPCTKEPYVEGDSKTVRKILSNAAYVKKTEFLICLRGGPLMYIGIYK